MLKVEGELEVEQHSKPPKSTARDHFLKQVSTWKMFSNHPKQHHQAGTKCSKTWAQREAISYLNHHRPRWERFDNQRDERRCELVDRSEVTGGVPWRTVGPPLYHWITVGRRAVQLLPQCTASYTIRQNLMESLSYGRKPSRQWRNIAFPSLPATCPRLAKRKTGFCFGNTNNAMAMQEYQCQLIRLYFSIWSLWTDTETRMITSMSGW